jgi:hypothetical protein
MNAATKNPGRPATGVGTPVQVRLSEIELAAVDSFRKSEADLPSRPEAIRRLVKAALLTTLKR